MDLKPTWYDAIAKRVSRRRYTPRAVPPELRERLAAHISAAGVLGDVRVCLVEDAGETLFTGVLGAYGAVAGMSLTAAFIGRESGEGGCEYDVGCLGQAFILEATDLGLGTCWIAGSFDKERAARVVALEPRERVVAITPLGYPTERQTGSERLLRSAVRAWARIPVEKLAPRILDGASLVMSRAAKLYWTAPIDLGIARLHVELGAAHDGVRGTWEELPAPDVARFTPSA